MQIFYIEGEEHGVYGATLKAREIALTTISALLRDMPGVRYVYTQCSIPAPLKTLIGGLVYIFREGGLYCTPALMGRVESCLKSGDSETEPNVLHLFGTRADSVTHRAFGCIHPAHPILWNLIVESCRIALLEPGARSIASSSRALRETFRRITASPEVAASLDRPFRIHHMNSNKIRYRSHDRKGRKPCVIQIMNSATFHLEVIESVIVRYPLLLGHNPSAENGSILYLDLAPNTDPQFIKYIQEKYPSLILGRTHRYHFFIGVTLYPSDYGKMVRLDPRTHFFISHTYTPTAVPPNVRYLAPFSGHHKTFPATVLPFQEREQQHHPTYPPIFVVQGDLRRRRLDLLHKILRTPTKHPYQILLLCRKVTDPTLLQYKQVVAKENLGFVDYHREMTRVSGILTLISKETHSHYYETKCTSSINYARSYQLLCILDRDLQNIYQLKKAVVYAQPSQIAEAFQYGLEKIHEKMVPAPPSRAREYGPREKVRSSQRSLQGPLLPSHNRAPRPHGWPSLFARSLRT